MNFLSRLFYAAAPPPGDQSRSPPGIASASQNRPGVAQRKGPPTRDSSRTRPSRSARTPASRREKSLASERGEKRDSVRTAHSRLQKDFALSMRTRAPRRLSSGVERRPRLSAPESPATIGRECEDVGAFLRVVCAERRPRAIRLECFPEAARIIERRREPGANWRLATMGLVNMRALSREEVGGPRTCDRCALTEKIRGCRTSRAHGSGARPGGSYLCGA